MLGILKRFTAPEPAPEYRDGLLGVLVGKTAGEWCGEFAFRNYHVKVLLPGAKYHPSSTRLAFARSLLSGLEAKVESGLDYAARLNPSLWRGRLRFAALNLLGQTAGDAFALDFVMVGERKGKFWQVRFEGGQPVHLEYR